MVEMGGGRIWVESTLGEGLDVPNGASRSRRVLEVHPMTKRNYLVIVSAISLPLHKCASFIGGEP